MNKKCIIEVCVRDAKSRGLCYNCYSEATRLMKDGRTTWDKLVEMKLATEKRIVKRRSLFLNQYDKVVSQ